jgi:hypothetical protein
MLLLFGAAFVAFAAAPALAVILGALYRIGNQIETDSAIWGNAMV